jgi:hypothetical protein
MYYTPQMLILEFNRNMAESIQLKNSLKHGIEGFQSKTDTAEYNMLK